jgi:hypothetical protein
VEVYLQLVSQLVVNEEIGIWVMHFIPPMTKEPIKTLTLEILFQFQKESFLLKYVSQLSPNTGQLEVGQKLVNVAEPLAWHRGQQLIVHRPAHKWITEVLFVDVFAGVHRPIASLSKQLAENPLVVGVPFDFVVSMLSGDLDQYIVCLFLGPFEPN